MIRLSDKRREKEPRPQLTVGWAVPATRPVATAWQYRLLRTDGNVVIAGEDEDAEGPVDGGTPIAQALEIMGSRRWELVAVHDSPDGPVYVFKRPAGAR